MAFIRKFMTASGATGVQVCWKEHGEVVRVEHVGSATTEAEMLSLMKKARRVMDAGKCSLFDLEEFDDDSASFELLEGLPAGAKKKAAEAEKGKKSQKSL